MEVNQKFWGIILIFQFLLVEKSLQKVLVEVSSGTRYQADLTMLDFQNGSGELEIRDIFCKTEALNAIRFNFEKDKMFIRIQFPSEGFSLIKGKDALSDRWLTFDAMSFLWKEEKTPANFVLITFNLGNKETVLDSNGANLTVYVCPFDTDIIFVPHGTTNGEFYHNAMSYNVMTIKPSTRLNIKPASNDSRMSVIFKCPTSKVEENSYADTVSDSEILSVLKDFCGVKTDDYFYARFLRATKNINQAKAMLKDYVDFRKDGKYFRAMRNSYSLPADFDKPFIKKLYNETGLPVFIIEVGKLNFETFDTNQIQPLITFGYFVLHYLEQASEEVRRTTRTAKILVIVDLKDFKCPRQKITGATKETLMDALNLVPKYFPQLFEVALLANPCDQSETMVKALGAKILHVLVGENLGRATEFVDKRFLPLEYGGQNLPLEKITPITLSASNVSQVYQTNQNQKLIVDKKISIKSEGSSSISEVQIANVAQQDIVTTSHEPDLKGSDTLGVPTVSSSINDSDTSDWKDISL